MTLLDRFSTWFGGLGGRTVDGSGRVISFGGRPTRAGVAINDASALSIPAFRRGIGLKVDAMAGMDLIVARRVGKDGWERVDDHPLSDLLASSPNVEQTSFSFRQAAYGHLNTRGNAYIEIASKRADGLRLMNPRATTARYDEDGSLVYDSDGVTLPASSVIHLRGLGYDGLTGYNPIAFAAESLGLVLAEQTYQQAIFGNNAQSGGILEVPGKLDEKQLKTLREDQERIHKGAAEAGKMRILSDGMKWIQNQFSPTDAQLILARGFSVVEVARILGLPAFMLDAPGEPRPADPEMANRLFFQQTLLPMITAGDQEYTKKLLRPQERRAGLFIKHDPSNLLKLDFKTLVETNDLLLDDGVISLDDFRVALGLPRLDTAWSKKHRMAVNNFQFLEDMKPGEATQPAVSRPVAEPDPNPLPQSKAKPNADAARALRAVIAEPIGRLAKVEATALRRAAGKTSERFDLLAAQCLEDSAARLCSALAPHVVAANSILGLSLTPDAIARDVAADALAELRDVWTVYSPEEIAGKVEPIFARWEIERGPSVAGRYVVDPQIGAGG